MNHFGPLIAADLRKRHPKPRSIWHLDEVYLKIDGRMAYLWRAVYTEGRVLDILVQSKRDKRAAVKLMRKLLKKYAMVPIGWRRTIRDPAARLFGIWALNAVTNGANGKTIGRRIRINPLGEERAKCSGSGAQAQPKKSCPLTQPSTIPSTFSAISSQPKHTAHSAPKR